MPIKTPVGISQKNSPVKVGQENFAVQEITNQH